MPAAVWAALLGARWRYTGWGLNGVVPGYSDELAYELGLIDTELPFPAAKHHFRIDDDALRAAGRDDFSQRIRQGL